MSAAGPLLGVVVWAPPELRTTAPGLLLPGAVTDTDVCEPEVLVEVCARLVERRPAVAGSEDVAEAVDEAGVSAVSEVDESDSEEDDVESVSAGSAQAMPGLRAIAAPKPRAAASSPTRPMWLA